MGGCCSLLVVLLTLIVLFTEFYTVIFKDNFSVQFSQHFRAETYELTPENQYQIPQSDFIPAILLVNQARVVNIEDYVTLGFYFYQRSLDEDGQFVTSNTTIKL